MRVGGAGRRRHLVDWSLLAFWIPVAVFTAWMIVLPAMLFRAIKDEERQYQEGRKSAAESG
jgi:hypothetical protein